MEIVEAVQRLEELAVELDCEELQGIANALDLADGQDCPKCKNYEKDRQFLGEMYYRLERMGYGRSQRVDDLYRENMSTNAMNRFYQYGIPAMSPDMAKLIVDTGS